MTVAIAFWDPVRVIIAAIPFSIYREGERDRVDRPQFPEGLPMLHAGVTNPGEAASIPRATRLSNSLSRSVVPII